MVDVERLKRSWARAAAHGDQVPLRFYSRLFVAAPETREMFPLSMVGQRDRLVAALGHTVSHVDDLERLVPYLQQLGRDHRRFGVTAQHYGLVGEALLATLGDFLGTEWDVDLEQDWADAYGLVAHTMIEAAERDARYSPPFWEAEVVAHERRTFDIAVLTLRPEQCYEYVPGQSLAVETPLRPRLWRYYSPANAPRSDGTIELHVRRVPGGQVSGALVDRVQKRDALYLGAPIGYRLALPAPGDQDLVMIAGGTGLAPLKAVVEQLAQGAASGARPRNVRLFTGARTARELYDMDALWDLEAEHLWLTVTPVAEEDPVSPSSSTRGSRGRRARRRPVTEVGTVGEVALRLGLQDREQDEVYVCGSDRMVVATLRLLREAGCPPDQLHFEGFQGLGGDTYGVVDLGGRSPP